MNGQELTLFAAIGALAGVFLPLLSGTGQKYRYRKMVRCPDTKKSAEVYIVASREVLSSLTAIKAKACSLWPQRKRCAQRCLARK
jgi:hypothetical protein